LGKAGVFHQLVLRDARGLIDLLRTGYRLDRVPDLALRGLGRNDVVAQDPVDGGTLGPTDQTRDLGWLDRGQQVTKLVALLGLELREFLLEGSGYSEKRAPDAA